MNAKKSSKHRRRITKISAKNERSAQCRKITEGKIKNISTKRVTLRPGFLINGFTSGTAKKVHKAPHQHKGKDHLVTDNLQAFLEQKSPPRRSQRINKKNIEDNESNSSNNFEGAQGSRVSQNNTLLTVCPSTTSIKSILKKNSKKSIFRVISDQLSRVNLQSKLEENHLNIPPKELEKETRMEDSIMDRVEINDNHKADFHLKVNATFCQEFISKICVKFRNNAVEDSQDILKQEISNVNLVLQGKLVKEDTVVYDTDSDSEVKDNGNNMLPIIPQRDWVYCTPRNQKINPPQVEECPIQPAVIYDNNHKGHNNLNVFGANKTTIFKRTPGMSCNFGADRVAMCNDRRQQEEHFFQSWSEQFQKPPPLIPTQIPLNPTATMQSNYLQPQLSPPLPGHNVYSNNFEPDFTFIADGNDFKIQESQRLKRPLSGGEDTFGNKKVNFLMDTSKMFDFGSQDRNIFDFAGIV